MIKFRLATAMNTWRINSISQSIGIAFLLTTAFGVAEEDKDFLIPEMVYLPGGVVEIGSMAHVAAQPIHEVTIAPFYIAKYEVTFAEFDMFTRATGGIPRHDLGWGRDKRPVVDTSWHDAKEYASWLSERTGDSYRLPSEAEWEYAARAGEPIARFNWGNSVGMNNANCRDCTSKEGGIQTSTVGNFEANDYGLYDVHGNVWEMVEDCFTHSYYVANTKTNRATSDECRTIVVRGGSWETTSDQMAVWYRGDYLKDRASSDVGFRLVKEASF